MEGKDFGSAERVVIDRYNVSQFFFLQASVYEEGGKNVLDHTFMPKGNCKPTEFQPTMMQVLQFQAGRNSRRIDFVYRLKSL